MGLSPLELAVVFLVVMLLFGVKRLPELGSGLGQAISNFKKSYKDGLSVDVTSKSFEEKSSEEAVKLENANDAAAITGSTTAGARVAGDTVAGTTSSGPILAGSTLTDKKNI